MQICKVFSIQLLQRYVLLPTKVLFFFSVNMIPLFSKRLNSDPNACGHEISFTAIIFHVMVFAHFNITGIWVCIIYFNIFIPYIDVKISVQLLNCSKSGVDFYEKLTPDFSLN